MNRREDDDDDDDEDDDVVPTLVPIPTMDWEHTKEISAATTTTTEAFSTSLMVAADTNPTVTRAEETMTTTVQKDSSGDSRNITNTDVLSFVTNTNTTTANIKNSNSNSKNKCPVTILSGCLGAGKSTLVQYILSSPDHGKRIAVIENEFGSSNTSNTNTNSSSGTSIEAMIVRNGIKTTTKQTSDDDDETEVEPPEFIDLPNGCVCCTVKDSLVITLEQLLHRTNNTTTSGGETTTQPKRPIDYILIECSGLANPGSIASIFWLDDALQSSLRLDGIITMVDCINIEQQLCMSMSSSMSSLYDATRRHTESIAQQQIAYADRILLNKIDLLPPPLSERTDDNNSITNSDDDSPAGAATSTTITRIVQLIRDIHPTVPIRTTSYAAIPDLDWILNTSSFDMEQQYANNNDNTIVVRKPTTSASNPNSYFGKMTTCNPCIDNNNNDDNKNSVDRYSSKRNASTTKFDHRRTLAMTSTVTLTIHGGLMDLTKLHLFLASILWPNQDESDQVLRSKMETEQQRLQQKGRNIETVLPTTSTSNSTTETRQQQQQQNIFRIKGIISVGFVTPMDEIDNHNRHDDVDHDEMLQFLTRFVPSPTMTALDHTSNNEKNDDDDTHPISSSTSSNSNTTTIIHSDIRRYIVQGVYDLWDVHPCTNPELFWYYNHHTATNNATNDGTPTTTTDIVNEQQQVPIPVDGRISQMIIIGQHLQKRNLQRGFENCTL